MPRLLTLLISTLLLSACGTLVTLTDSDERISFGMERSHCNRIPYIYSGVVYDFCMLNGEPRMGAEGAPMASGDGPFIFLGVDLVLSGVLDTAALPYTIYRNSRGGYLIVVK